MIRKTVLTMKYKIRVLQIRSKKEGIAEFEKVGSTAAGNKIMINKAFPLSIKIKQVNTVAANILKQEMLARDGDVITSRSILTEKRAKTDIIIQGTRKSITSLVKKIRSQQFGLGDLSGDLSGHLKKMDKACKEKDLIIADKKFEPGKEVVIMGILNVTRDSFYDGGQYYDREKALARARSLAEEGAHIIDVGGMSTRPGSLPVGKEEEMERTIPVIENISRDHDILISIDTYRPEVAAEAIKAGAHIVNDISGLGMDESMAGVIAKSNVSVVLMHIKGTPENMQDDPRYQDVIEEIYQYFEDKTKTAISSGIGPEKIILDPGIGFGKRPEHNLEIISKLREFKMLGFPILVGASRKSFIGEVLGLPVGERLEGSLSVAVWSMINGADILRVHDVKETMRAVKMAQKIKNIY